jgi:hypothetical protein
MSNIAKRPRKQWAMAISVSWTKTVRAILETGRLLIKAKDALKHGEFGPMIESDLPFGPRTAEQLMAIARNPILSNANHGSHLPCSWRTLYELSRLPDKILQAKLDDGSLNAETDRDHVAMWQTIQPADEADTYTMQSPTRARMTVTKKYTIPLTPPKGAIAFREGETIHAGPIYPDEAEQMNAEPSRYYDALIAAWEAAGPDDRKLFLETIGSVSLRPL